MSSVAVCPGCGKLPPQLATEDAAPAIAPAGDAVTIAATAVAAGTSASPGYAATEEGTAPAAVLAGEVATAALAGGAGISTATGSASATARSQKDSSHSCYSKRRCRWRSSGTTSQHLRITQEQGRCCSIAKTLGSCYLVVVPVVYSSVPASLWPSTEVTALSHCHRVSRMISGCLCVTQATSGIIAVLPRRQEVVVPL